MAANLGSNFYPKLIEICKEVGMRPEDLLAVMNSESGLNPASFNQNGGASGLIQFIPPTLVGLGYTGTPAEFRTLSGEEQLPWVKKYIQSKGKGIKFDSAGKYYVANFFPAALNLPGIKNEDPKTPIIEKDPEELPDGSSKKYADIGAKISTRFEKIVYEANKGLDHGSKGVITYGDMIAATDNAKKSKSYQSVLSQLESDTGYRPSSGPDISTKPERIAPSMTASLEEMINEGLQMLKSVFAEETSLKRIYKKALPTHNILIQIAAPDYNSAIEFSRVLTSALDEDLLSTSYPYTDGSKVEVECSIQGPEKECFEAVQQMSEAIAEAFRDATIKIGGLKVKSKCIMNKKSSYQPISLRTATSNYRTFLLKFI